MPSQDWPKGKDARCIAAPLLAIVVQPILFLLQVAGTCRNNQAGMGMIVTLAVVDVQNRMGFADPYGFWLSLSQ